MFVLTVLFSVVISPRRIQIHDQTAHLDSGHVVLDLEDQSRYGVLMVHPACK
jgi:hypothetical protein